MKKISQISKEMNISTQAIYKKINKTMKAELQPYIKTIKGQTLVDDSGVEIIRNSLQPVVNQLATHDENISNNEVAGDLQPVDNHADSEFYKSQIELLQNELKAEREHSRKQSEQLAVLADKLAELTHNSQVLQLKSEEKNTLLLSGEQSPIPEKTSFWSKIFKKKGGQD